VVGSDAADSWYDPYLRDSYAPQWASACVSPAAARFEVTQSGTFEFVIDTVDQYTGYLLLCQQGTRLTADISTTLTNIDRNGKLTQPLSIEQALQPQLSLAVVIVWMLVGCAWAGELRRSHARLNRTHVLFTAIVSIRVLEVAVAAAYWARQAADGTDNVVLLHGIALLGNGGQVLFLLTLMLISLGLDFTRTRLSTFEMRGVLVAFLGLAALSLADAVCLSSEMHICSIVGLTEYVAVSLVMLATVVAINFQVANMRAAMQVNNVQYRARLQDCFLSIIIAVQCLCTVYMQYCVDLVSS
jgi:Rhodopsin-like GPCR transmembrane domain